MPLTSWVVAAWAAGAFATSTTGLEVAAGTGAVDGFLMLDSCDAADLPDGALAPAAATTGVVIEAGIGAAVGLYENALLLGSAPGAPGGASAPCVTADERG